MVGVAIYSYGSLTVQLFDLFYGILEITNGKCIQFILLKKNHYKSLRSEGSEIELISRLLKNRKGVVHVMQQM